jgi:hypothetical protein
MIITNLDLRKSLNPKVSSKWFKPPRSCLRTFCGVIYKYYVEHVFTKKKKSAMVNT